MNVQPLSEPVRRGCEVCGQVAMRELYTARDRLRNSSRSFFIVACDSCGTFRTLPEMTDRELAWFYPNEYWGQDASEDWIRSSQAEKVKFLASSEVASGTILDVGCGAGFFLRALNSKKWNRYGVEMSDKAARAANLALGAGRVFAGTLIEAECADSVFDVVTFWSALEHTNEPRATLAEARRIIKPGGSVIIQVPNAASYQARMFGGNWFALDVPRHRYHFTPKTLGHLLKQTGFEIYRATQFSKSHNSHSLRQSLKAKLNGDQSAIGRAVFLISIPFIKPFDFLMTALGQGATLTVAARAV
jgi:2-polyprenyl-3-methyl-5-hydroxy-6-metoxy-1,4-benzoquinol methylase